MKNKFPGFSKRLKLLLKDESIPKGIFASKLRISPGHVTNLLEKDSNPSPALIKSISREFSVNEEWLKSGSGERDKKRDEEANKTVGRSEMRIRSLLANAEEILRSASPFAEALEHNIDAFWYGYDLEKRGIEDPVEIIREPQS